MNLRNNMSNSADSTEHQEVLDTRDGGFHTDKSKWMKFEDWFWYDHHTLFEYQLNQYTHCIHDK